MTPSRPAGYALRAVFGDRGDEPARVLAEVARGFGVSVEDIRGPSRTTVVATARMCACAVLREATALSFPAIGRLVERDHTTVMHHHRRVMSDAELRSGVLAIAAELAAQRAGADPIHHPVQEV